MNRKWILRGGIFTLVIIVGAFLAHGSSSCVIKSTRAIVNGDSLQGDIENGSEVTVKNGYYKCNEVRRGDFVAYSMYGRKWPLVKVIRAIPGDTFSIVKNSNDLFQIIVAGEALRNASGELYALDDSHAKVLMLAERTNKGVVPAGTYIMLGDIVSGSLDSTKLGLIPMSKLIGKVVH